MTEKGLGHKEPAILGIAPRYPCFTCLRGDVFMMYDPRLAEDLWRFAEKMRYPNPAEIDYSELEYTLRRAADIVDGKEEREYQRTWKYLFKGLFKAAFSLFLYFCAFLEIYRFLDSHGLAGGDSPSGLMMFAALALFGGIIVLLSHDDGRGWLI